MNERRRRVAACFAGAAACARAARRTRADAPPPLPATRRGLAGTAARRRGSGADRSRARLGSEPAVRRTVIDDSRARIEELRVRGQLQKVTVSPKGRAPGYEIIIGDGAHAIGDDPGTSRGSAGKRVWNVLRF